MTQSAPNLADLRADFNRMWATRDKPTGVDCWACGKEIHVFGFRVDGVDLKARGRRARRRFVCAPCYLGRQIVEGRKNFTDGHELAGVEAHPCKQCGFLVVLKPDTRRGWHTCSEACRVALYRREKRRLAERRGVELPICQGCGAETDGRSDQLYCSSACRQRAYRQRRAT